MTSLNFLSHVAPWHRKLSVSRASWMVNFFSLVNLGVGCWNPRRVWCCIVLRTQNGLPIVGITFIRWPKELLADMFTARILPGASPRCVPRRRSHIWGRPFFPFLLSLTPANVVEVVIRCTILRASGSYPSGWTYAIRSRGKNFQALPSSLLPQSLFSVLPARLLLIERVTQYGPFSD